MTKTLRLKTPTRENSEKIYVERQSVSDPTQQTTIALARDINALHDIINAELKVLHATIEGHWSLDVERFKAVELRFNERDLRFSQATTDSSAAITVALATVNNANTRLEATFSKQIDLVGDRLEKQAGALADRITDLKDRITTIEGNRKGSENVIGWVIGSAGVILGIVIAVITGIFSLIHSGIIPAIH